ncbi:MAG: universal stress protein [Cyclobacteriaceae bacterium]
MEKILVPTDLSEKSGAALQYAIDFGLKDKAQIYFFNDAIRQEDEAGSESGLKEIISKVQAKHQGASEVSIEPKTDKGPVLEGINKMLKADKYGLVVMMTHGHEGLDQDVGSITAKIAQKGKAPTLVVPENVTYKKVSNVLVVNDFTDARNDEPAFAYLSQLISKLEVKVQLLQAISKTGKAKPTESFAGVMGNVKAEKTEKTSFETYQELIQYVKDYCAKNDIDLIFLPNSQAVYEKIFVGNMARLISIETKIPVLIQW